MGITLIPAKGGPCECEGHFGYSPSQYTHVQMHPQSPLVSNWEIEAANEKLETAVECSEVALAPMEARGQQWVMVKLIQRQPLPPHHNREKNPRSANRQQIAVLQQLKLQQGLCERMNARNARVEQAEKMAFCVLQVFHWPECKPRLRQHLTVSWSASDLVISRKSCTEADLSRDECGVANFGCTLPLEGETLEDSGGGGRGEALLQNQRTMNGPNWLHVP